MSHLTKVGDERYTPTIATGKDTINLAGLNEIIRQIFTAIQNLDGRLGLVTIHGPVVMEHDLIVEEGITVNGAIIGDAVVGSWTKTSNSLGTGDYAWDLEISNNETYFVLDSSDTAIAFLVAGKYLVTAGLNANTDASGTAEAILSHEGNIVARAAIKGLAASDETTLNLSAIVNVEANEVVVASLVVGDDRLGDLSKSSRISVTRLN